MKAVKSGILKPALMRWGGLAVIALAELTWLAIRVEENRGINAPWLARLDTPRGYTGHSF
jgi:hypothetical protein